MRGCFTATAAFDVLAERFGITLDVRTNEELTARYNVALTKVTPIITVQPKSSKRPVIVR